MSIRKVDKLWQICPMEYYTAVKISHSNTKKSNKLNHHNVNQCTQIIDDYIQHDTIFITLKNKH